jgi:4-hydroxyacetophenone monooxygenase
MYGPGTHLAHGASLIFHSECQMRYISQCLDELVSSGRMAMEPRQQAYDDWHARTQREIKTLVWSQPSIKHSYFKNAYGEIHGVSPWRVCDYWAWTATPDLADFEIR